MVGSAGWRWCNVLALVTSAASSAGPQDEEHTSGGVVRLHDCTAADCRPSRGLSTTRPLVRNAETDVIASLDIESTLPVRPEHATHSNITASNACSLGSTVRAALTLSSGTSSSEQDSFHLRSQETLRVSEGVIEETGVEKESEESKGNMTFILNGASSSNSWLDSCATEDNMVPYSRSDGNANTSAVQNNLEKCARLNQDQDNCPWFSHYGEDMYDHVTRGLVYIETSIPGPGLDMDIFQQMPQGCNCQEDCSKGNGRETRLSYKTDASVNRSANALDMSELVHKKNMSELVHKKYMSELVHKKNISEVDRNCCKDEQPGKLTVLSSGSVAQNSRCSQDGVTVSSGCSCSDRTPDSYRKGLLVQPNLPWPIYECNDDCHCPATTSPRPTNSGCQNRVVQRGPRRDLVIRKAKGKPKRCLANGGGASSVVCDSQWSKCNGLSDVSMDQSDVNAALSLIDQVPQSVSKLSTSSPDKGFGVFTKLFIPRGSFICEYAGELLGKEEARRRFARQEREGKNNYILVLREFYGEDDVTHTDASTGIKRESPKYHPLKHSQRDAAGQNCNVTIPNQIYSKNASANEISTKHDSGFLNECKKDIFSLSTLKPAQVTIIDPTSIGNIGRYLNHSCDPNTHVVPVRVNSVIPVAAMFAVRDVYSGEELVYDYGSVVEAAPPRWTNGHTANAADEVADCSDGDVDGLGSMSNNVGDCSKSSRSHTRGSLEMRDANVTPTARVNSLDVEEMTVGLQKRRILKHDPCWGQHQSTEKKQKFGAASFSSSVEVKAFGSRTDELEWRTPMATVDFDVIRKSPCLCGAQKCRGYLPAEVDLF